MSDIGTALTLVDKIRSDIGGHPDIDDLVTEGRLRFPHAPYAFVAGVLEMRLAHVDQMLVRLTSVLRDLEVEDLEQMYQEEGLA